MKYKLFSDYKYTVKEVASLSAHTHTTQLKGRQIYKTLQLTFFRAVIVRDRAGLTCPWTPAGSDYTHTYSLQ